VNLSTILHIGYIHAIGEHSMERLLFSIKLGDSVRVIFRTASSIASGGKFGLMFTSAV
jgi:hypothetical protein